MEQNTYGDTCKIKKFKVGFIPNKHLHRVCTAYTRLKTDFKQVQVLCVAKSLDFSFIVLL